MRRPHLLLSLIVLAFALTSCFEIIEEVDLKANGTGTYEYTLNASQSKTRLEQVMRMDSINGYRVPKRDELEEPLAKLMAQAKAVPGISNVQKVEDFDNFIFSFSCDFDDIDALNRLVKRIREETKDKRTDIPYEHFTYDEATGRYFRNGAYHISGDLDRMNEADRLIFDGATFTSIFRSDRPIETFSNAAARLSPSKTALMLRLPVIDLMKERANMGNTIQLSQ